MATMPTAGIIDGDGHVLEPATLWEDYLEPSMRARAITVKKDQDGLEYLEIDGAPSHLDLDGDHARAAVAAGVTVSIDSDCHRARLLDRQMQLGVGTARRGWVEPRHVLNARPLDDVRAFIQRKRRRQG